MLRQLTVILTLCICCFYSCKKDETPTITIIYGKSYYKERIDKAGKFRAFTKSGEINNAGILSRLEADSYFHLQYYIDNYIQFDDMDSVIFFNNQTARVVNNYVPQNFVYSQDRNNIILTQKDTTVFYIYGDLYSNSLRYNIAKYRPELYSEELKSSFGGNYLFIAGGKNKQVFSAVKNIITAPQIAMVHYSLNYTRPELINNEFAENFVQKIPVNDTVAVQMYSVTYQ